MIARTRPDWLIPMYWILLATIAGFAGCDSGSSNGPTSEQPPPAAEIQNYSVQLHGRQVVPMVQTNQSARATVTVNETDLLVMAEMDLGNVTGVNAAHIHTGEAGTNGPIVFGFSDTDSDGIWMIESEDISQAQHEVLLAGNWYINVHTDDFPDGELRGQILSDTQNVNVFPLSGEQQVPPVPTDAYGHGYLFYDGSSGVLTLNTWAWNLTATAVHIHNAEAGLNGDVVVGWEAGDEDDLWQLPETTVLGSNDITALTMANLYVNVQTNAHPDGEIRGQILPNNYQLILFPLSPEQEVPPVASQAGGMGYASLNIESGGLRLNVWAWGMETNAAHIHQGDVGENGDVAMALEKNGEHTGLWQTPQNTGLTSGTQDLLLAGGHYVNMHSDDFPEGEIRGQIID